MALNKVVKDTDAMEEQLRSSLEGFRMFNMIVPQHIHAGLVDYIVHGVPVGNFLEAVLKNDLREACARADSINVLALPVIVAWLYNDAPAGSWGNPKAYEEWIS